MEYYTFVYICICIYTSNVKGKKKLTRLLSVLFCVCRARGLDQIMYSITSPGQWLLLLGLVRERAQRGASEALGNVLLFYLGASYIGPVFENSSSWTFDFFHFFVCILYIIIKLMMGPNCHVNIY